MPWPEIFAVFVVSHLVGDYLLQTEWQAHNKHGGLGPDPVRRRALLSHVATYGLAFVPALVWLATTSALGRALPRRRSSCPTSSRTTAGWWPSTYAR